MSAKRPSNPATVAKVIGRSSALAPAPARRAGKKKGRDLSSPDLPASIVMEAVRTLQGEALSTEGDGSAPAPSFGVLYRLIARDAEQRPLAPGAPTLRRHLLPAAGAQSDPSDARARITIVTLGEGGAAEAFVGLTGDAARSAKGGRLFEYFSFELQGMTYVVPSSGYLLRLKRSGSLLQISRAPHEGESIHGAIRKGLLAEGAGDTFVCRLE